MKTDEVKLRLLNFVNDTIDIYIPPTNFFDKLKNATAKLWIEQNKYRINKAVDAFGDENNEIDVDKVIECYCNAMFENGELRLDVKNMIPSSFDSIKDYLPNKIILFKEDDFKGIFKNIIH